MREHVHSEVLRKEQTSVDHLAVREGNCRLNCEECLRTRNVFIGKHLPCKNNSTITEFFPLRVSAVTQDESDSLRAKVKDADTVLSEKMALTRQVITLQ